MRTKTTPSTSAPSAHELPPETFEILAATLCELFQMPCDEMLRHLNAQFAAQNLDQIKTQAPGALIYAGVGDTGLVATVADNRDNANRSTANIVAYLQQQGLNGISIDSEGDGMSSVVELVPEEEAEMVAEDGSGAEHNYGREGFSEGDVDPTTWDWFGQAVPRADLGG